MILQYLHNLFTKLAIGGLKSNIMRSNTSTKLILIFLCIVGIYVFTPHIKFINASIRLNKNLTKSDIWVIISANGEEPCKQIDNFVAYDGLQVLVIGNHKQAPKCTNENIVYFNENYEEIVNLTSELSIHDSSNRKKLIGYLYAIKNGAKYIYETESDIVLSKHLKECFHFNKTVYGLTLNNTKVPYFNPYEHFGQPNIWPRGLFEGVLNDNIGNEYLNSEHKTAIVQHGMVNGNPDVDGIFRLTKEKSYKSFYAYFDPNAPPFDLSRSVLAPYPSSNTLYHYQAFWSFYLAKSVPERYRDIYRSYWAQRLMWLIDGSVAFRGPFATQLKDYNEHYLKSYEEDQRYHPKLLKLIQFLKEWNCWELNFYDCVVDLTTEMAAKEFWSSEEIDRVKEWINNLNKLEYQEPKLVLNASTPHLDTFPVRYVPNIQTNREKDEFCCDGKRTLFTQKDSLSYLNKFCSNSTTLPNGWSIFNVNYTKPVIPLGNYILLITFNHRASHHNIVFSKHLYGYYFNHVVFCGPGMFDSISNFKEEFKGFHSFSLIEYETYYGYFHHQCMNKVIEMNFNTDGILLMSDDVMLKYWNLNPVMDFSKVWFTRKVACWEEIDPNNQMSVDNQKWIWNGEHGLSQLLKTWNEFSQILDGTIPTEDEHKNMLKEYLAHLESHWETKSQFPKVCWGESDIFYLPKTKFRKYQYISDIFQHYNVFIELVVGTVLSGLAPLKEIDLLKGGYQWECNHCFKFEWETERVEPLYHFFLHFYHPIKHSVVREGLANKNFCNLFIKEKLLKDTEKYS